RAVSSLVTSQSGRAARVGPCIGRITREAVLPRHRVEAGRWSCRTSARFARSPADRRASVPLGESAFAGPPYYARESPRLRCAATLKPSATTTQRAAVCGTPAYYARVTARDAIGVPPARDVQRDLPLKRTGRGHRSPRGAGHEDIHDRLHPEAYSR